MRKVLTILFLAISLAASAQQVLAEPEIYLGGHAGVGATIAPWTFAPTGGLAFHYTNRKNCGLAVELNYRNQYITLPFLMHLTFGPKMGRAVINLGPEIGAPLAGQKFHWGITAGLGAQLKTRKSGLFELDARYMFGFAEMSHELAAHIGWYWPIRKRDKQK